jgi:hypothetical protein
MSEEKSPAAVALGRLGRKAGKAHAENLTKDQRSEIAREAARGRREKKRREEQPS